MMPAHHGSNLEMNYRQRSYLLPRMKIIHLSLCDAVNSAACFPSRRTTFTVGIFLGTVEEEPLNFAGWVNIIFSELLHTLFIPVSTTLTCVQGDGDGETVV